MRRSIVLIAALFVTAAGCGSGEQPNLPLNAVGAKDSAAAADMAMRIGNVRYELADGVKADKDTQDAYQFDGVTLDDANRVAKAFGISGAPRDDETGWTIGDSPSVYVGRNGAFSVNGDAAVSSGVVCAEPEGGQGDGCPPTTTTTTPPNFPTAEEARAVATSALKAAGVDLNHAEVTVETSGLTHTVSFQQKVEGANLQGYEHFVAVTLDKKIAYGSGILGSPKSVGTYELATLQSAVERLNNNDSGVRTMEAQPAPIDSEPQVVKLTGVKVGLMMTTDDADQSLWLTPAYVFTTDPDQGDVVAPAAADKYFPTTTTTARSPDDKPPASDGGGSTEPAPPRSTLPSDGQACSSNATGPSSGENKPITAQVCASASEVKAGTEVVFAITFSDPDRAFVNGPCGDAVAANYGDDSGGEAQCLACPTGVPDGPGSGERKRTHTYATPGTYSATFTVKSGNTCGPADPHDSTATVSVPITVR